MCCGYCIIVCYCGLMDGVKAWFVGVSGLLILPHAVTIGIASTFFVGVADRGIGPVAIPREFIAIQDAAWGNSVWYYPNFGIMPQDR